MGNAKKLGLLNDLLVYVHASTCMCDNKVKGHHAAELTGQPAPSEQRQHPCHR